MKKEKLIRIVENGKQIGVSKMIENNGYTIVYTYAIQKKQDKYVVYIDEYNLDTAYADEMDEPTEVVVVYENIFDCIHNFDTKYNIQFEDLGVSKGQKYFNIDFYI